MIHIDLFSGIGGFAYAIDQVYENTQHIFCDNDPFCQAVLKKHWPHSQIYADIRAITSDTISCGHFYREIEKLPAEGAYKALGQFEPSIHSPFILTGGFPCQPFSQAGRRKGTEDDRHLWPEMLRVIRLTQPQWVVAENVRGLLTIGGGVVFEQVCADLEASGYVVQPFVIPAVAVNAPHRRDRVWFVAHAKNIGNRGDTREVSSTDEQQTKERQKEWRGKSVIADSERDSRSNPERKGHERNIDQAGQDARHSRGTQWDKNWFEVATRLCRMDDGLPRDLHFFGGIEYTDSHEQDPESEGAEAIPTLTKSIRTEMSKVWEYWQTPQASSENESKDIHNPVHSMPCEGTPEAWYGKLGKTEKEKELRSLWKGVCTEPFKEAQLLFPRMLEHIRAVERSKKVGNTQYTKSGHRNVRLKALGNAIVPQVAEEIMKAIKQTL